MIGLGTWQCSVDTMFFRGDAQIKIFDNNGEYDFELSVPGIDIPNIVIKDIEEDGNSLTAIATTDLLPGKDINISLEFEDTTFTGFLKVPFIGKIKLKDGKKIA